MSELWEKELEQPDYECCSECGSPLYDGDAYYDINGDKICDDCMSKYRCTMNYDDYTYQDYLTDKYERERHDV